MNQIPQKHAFGFMALLPLALSLAVFVPATTEAKEPKSISARPSNWAKPIDLPGVPNLYRVSKNLYRSAQPTSQGMVNLEKKLGIKTIINLRLFHSDRDEIKGTELEYIHIPLKTWKVKKKHVLRFLEAVTDLKKQPVLVHCNHGADRTGTMVAFYRMVVQGWDKSAALDEMKHGGFNYHSIWINLVDLIEDANIDEYKVIISNHDSP